jgi:hypothetical protein
MEIRVIFSLFCLFYISKIIELEFYELADAC